MKRKKTETAQYAPIVFMNTPICDDEGDVIGIGATVTAIKKASERNAKMIGVIADYGSGKSSLTDTLAKDTKRFGKAIRINMWDSLSENSSQITISALTKSFLYQLASGISDNTAKHVNRRLSKNYGIVSFSISSRIFWLWAALAATAYVVFAIISGISVETISGLIQTASSNISQISLFWWTSITKYSASLFLVLGIAFAIIGLRNTSIAFSHWKSQTPRDLEVNDVFEAYTYIYKKLMTRNQRRLIILEDLDRINRKNLVVGFLKEIYRFNSLTQEACKNGPLFIVSIKPESHLKDYDDKGIPLSAKLDDDEVYAKMFDYTVTLKPIHYADYGDIVLDIIGKEDSETRKYLQSILEERDRIQENKLPASFSWIITGHTLTIRQLKERLNRAIALLITLKNKGYANQSYIRLSACAAVTYLELQYPELYIELIKQEDSFSQLVQNSYAIKNHSSDKAAEMKKSVDQLFGLIVTQGIDAKIVNNMKSDIVKMLLTGDISDDFRMYFYSFPRGSYIKNGDERDLTNLLLLPNEYSVDDKLAEKIDRIIEMGKEKTVVELLTQIANDAQKGIFPAIILNSEFLFKNAYTINPSKVEATVYLLASWESNNRRSSQEIIAKLYTYSFDLIEKFWENYAVWLFKRMDEFDDDSKIDIRKRIISIFGNEIIVFKDIFIGQQGGSYTMPIISEGELQAIPSVDVSISLINLELIGNINYEYIIAYINRFKLNNSSYKIAHEIYEKLIRAIPANVLWRLLVSFLKINAIADSKFFSYAVSGISSEASDKEVISQYVNSLSIDQITNDYCNILDEAIIDVNLSDAILKLLFYNQKYVALLSSLIKVNRLSLVNFVVEENSKNIVLVCEKLVAYNKLIIPEIRLEIIRQFNAANLINKITESYLPIFSADYPIISKQEYHEMNNVPVMLQLLNRRLINSSNYSDIVAFINNNVQIDDCLENLKLLLSDEYEDKYQDNSIATKIIEALDLRKIGFCELDSENKEKALKYFAIYIDLTNPSTACNYMSRINCLIPSLERAIVASGNIEMYINIIKQIDMPTKYTIEWLMGNEILFALSPNLLNELLNQKQEDKYLVGKVLADEAFEFPYSDVQNSTVIENYTPTSPIWHIIKDDYDLANYIIQNKCYEGFRESDFPEILRPLYSGKQTCDFIKFIFPRVSELEKLYYLEQMGEILDPEESIAISTYLIEEPNIRLLREDSLFYRVRERLWEDVPKHSGYKGVFTRKRNFRFPTIR